MDKWKEGINENTQSDGSKKKPNVKLSTSRYKNLRKIVEEPANLMLVLLRTSLQANFCGLSPIFGTSKQVINWMTWQKDFPNKFYLAGNIIN